MEGGRKRKVVIDCDPGIDDAYAVYAALSCRELEVVGITTVFGNVTTPEATRNALHLLEVAGLAKGEVPVVQGALGPLASPGAPHRVAGFVHGSDGLGDTDVPIVADAALLRQAAASHEGRDAAAFLAELARAWPGQLHVVCLASLTNLALCLRRDPEVAPLLASVAFLGGAIFVNGNVSPAAEANVLGDPEAADEVFRAAGLRRLTVIPLDASLRCPLAEHHIETLRAIGGRVGPYLHGISQFYVAFHERTYGRRIVYPHDALVVLALLAEGEGLFQFAAGAVRVCVDPGLMRGLTVMDARGRTWHGEGARPWNLFDGHGDTTRVALGCNGDALVALLMRVLAGDGGVAYRGLKALATTS